MDPTQLLRERECRLMAEYRASRAPRAFDWEDLQCEDPAIIKHWVDVYTELVEFAHSVIGPASADRPSGEGPKRQSALELQTRVLELHLAYWTGRLGRSGEDPGPEA